MKAKHICQVKGCDQVAHGKGFCHKHYQQLRKHGEIFRITRYDANEIIVDGDIGEQEDTSVKKNAVFSN